MQVSDALAVLAALVDSSRHPEALRALVIIRRSLAERKPQVNELPDLIAHLDDGRQEVHDRARRENPDHDQVSCVCCCFDCDE